jgi:hypothetical protein
MAVDLVAVLFFVGIGRVVRAHGMNVAGVASTAWPFLSGLMAGWALCATSRRPASSVTGGLVVWIVTVAGGMALRVVSGQGEEASTPIAILRVARAGATG